MKRRLKKSHIFILIVMLICPVVGPIFFLLAYLWYKLFFS